MRIHLLAAAVAVAVALLPNRSQAQAEVPVGSRSDSAALFVDRLLMHQGELSLSGGQVQQLTALADRLREDQGRLRIVGLDRVPGKSVPHYKRVRPSAKEALRSALRYLAPEQGRAAAAFLDAPEERASHSANRSSAATAYLAFGHYGGSAA